MDGNIDNIVVCCFCGESLSIKKAVLLSVRLNINNEEVQNLFAHRQHFVEKINSTILLHPDFFVEDE